MSRERISIDLRRVVDNRRDERELAAAPEYKRSITVFDAFSGFCLAAIAAACREPKVGGATSERCRQTRERGVPSEAGETAAAKRESRAKALVGCGLDSQGSHDVFLDGRVVRLVVLLGRGHVAEEAEGVVEAARRVQLEE